jgi:tetratricopeptide (TPR) repeat protein
LPIARVWILTQSPDVRIAASAVGGAGHMRARSRRRRATCHQPGRDFPNARKIATVHGNASVHPGNSGLFGAAMGEVGGHAGTDVMSPAEALKYAERCCAEGRLAEAESVCRQIVQAQPNLSEAAHMLAIITYQSGRTAEAIEHTKRAIAIKPNVALYHANLGEMCRLAGRLDEAVAAARRALEINPRYAGALSNLGIALFEQGKFADAVAHYDRAIALEPNFVLAHSNRGNALQRLKRFAEAEAAYRRALALQPAFAAAWNNLGTCLRELKRPEEAESVYRKALELAPNDPGTLDNLALALKDLDRLDEAAGFLRRALAVDARNDKFLVHYAVVLIDQNKPDEAATAAQSAAALNPGSPDAAHAMGRVAFARGNLDASLNHYRRAIALKPDFADAHNNMGNVLKDLGQLTAAHAAFVESLRLDPDIAGVYANLADTKKFTPGDPDLAAMERLTATSERRSKSDRLQLDFALGKAYADLKDYDRSFRHLVAANAAKRTMIVYDERRALALFDRIEATFTREFIAGKSGGGDPSAMPIFVIGMPRSGTTLIEQILASHPAVHGAGELKTFSDVVNAVRGPHGNILAYPEFMPALDAGALRRLGARYVSEVRKLAPAPTHVTDKMPSNYYFAGLIHLALPNAKIIHVSRDPVDTCISCFSKLFADEQSHTYDLAELGRYYQRYARLMTHWRDVLPERAILDVRYEDVVGDLEAQARRIIAHCGLPWDARCLAFHETDRPVRTASAAQVRQPIYTSAVGRSRVYTRHLGPLLDALGGFAESSPAPSPPKRRPRKPRGAPRTK